jgi:hypothetical protein
VTDDRLRQIRERLRAYRARDGAQTGLPSPRGRATVRASVRTNRRPWVNEVDIAIPSEVGPTELNQHNDHTTEVR